MAEELSFKSKLVRYLVSEFNSRKSLTDKFTAGSYGKSDMDIDYKYPEHLVAERIDMGNFEMEKLVWIQEKESEKISDKESYDILPDEDLRINSSRSRWVILQLHGGGYVGAMRKQYKQMAGLYSEVGGGATVLTVDYRVAPEYPFPAALEDAMASYDWLLEHGYKPDQIVLAGDSAGGGLCMALCHTLKSMWRELPAGIIAMSPWTDLTVSGPSYTENYDIDPVFGNDRSALIFDNPYIGDANPRDPRISPAFGDFTGFPPMLIQVGTNEMLLSDSELVAGKAKAAGVKVRFTKYPGMFHVFQMAGTIMQESKMAWAEVKRFLEEI